jgi:demethylmenaquinone methyltransferase/2-methoxy-6-polyprenyl-1,4-benzoquinol methylase
MKILRGAGIQPGQTVLEVGCGTGFHTVSAAQLIGDHGCLVAMDVLSDYVERVSTKVRAAELRNVRVLLSVIPSPTLPLNRFLPEMHRVLKPEGALAVTTFPWVLRSLRRSELFTYIGKRNGVNNFRRR